MTNKSKSNQTRHAFLLTFFDQVSDHYEVKHVNGFWLVKQWNKSTQSWEVAIYTPDSFQKRADFLNQSTKPSDTATDVPSN